MKSFENQDVTNSFTGDIDNKVDELFETFCETIDIAVAKFNPEVAIIFNNLSMT